jgi:polar amino acid transport system permease protein
VKRDGKETTAAGDPAAVVSDREAIKAIPVRHWGRWISAAVIVYFAVALLFSFAKNPNVEWPVIKQYLFSPEVLRGVVVTLYLTVVSMVIGIVGGTLLAVMRLSSNYVLSTVAWVYIWFFRGTPVLVQILFWGYLGSLYPKLFLGLPFTGLIAGSAETGKLISATVAAILALGLNEAAYSAELVRAGIISVDKGQDEAAESLGMSPALTMRRITLPQAMRVIIPPMGNETISMLKTTSLVYAIAGQELLTRVTILYSQNFLIIPLLLVASFWYIFFTTLMTIGQHYLEAYFGKGFGEKEAEAAERRALKRESRRA